MVAVIIIIRASLQSICIRFDRHNSIWAMAEAYGLLVQIDDAIHRMFHVQSVGYSYIDTSC